jgi:uncharacterized protein YbjT (DUF2867 family)
MNVFLTGGTGFIGQALVARILMRGWSLKVLVRDPEAVAARWIEKQGATRVQGDVTTPAALAAALKESDVLILNAGVYELGANPTTVAQMNAVNVQLRTPYLALHTLQVLREWPTSCPCGHCA